MRATFALSGPTRDSAMEFLNSNPWNPRGEPFTGLNRFGRLTGTVWKTSSTDLVDTRYGYDAAGIPLWRQDAVAGSANDQDNFCDYANLYHLTAWQRGGKHSMTFQDLTCLTFTAFL